MPYQYDQSTGTLTRDGTPITTGYSGIGPGLNNPAEQATHNVGPIPQGGYTIGDMITDGGHMGPHVLPLTPDADNEMFGRSGFFIHGDKIAGPPNTASNGCIVIGMTLRLKIAASGDRRLVVVG